VDSTLVDSLKVRENLLRTKTQEADQPKGVIKSSASKKACVTDTLEKNLSAITEVKRNQAFSVDPLFRQMTQKFDNGGAQGMLLNSLPVKQGCFVAFDSAQALFSEVPQSQSGKCETEEDNGESSQCKAEKNKTAGIQLPMEVLSTFKGILSHVNSLPTCSALLDVLYNEASAEEPFKNLDKISMPKSNPIIDQQSQVYQHQSVVWADAEHQPYFSDNDGDDDIDDGCDDEEYLKQLTHAPYFQGGEGNTSPASNFDFWSNDSAGESNWNFSPKIDIEVAIRKSGLSDYTFFDARFNRRPVRRRVAKGAQDNTKNSKKEKKTIFLQL
jgi:hypothetical protein